MTLKVMTSLLTPDELELYNKLQARLKTDGPEQVKEKTAQILQLMRELASLQNLGVYVDMSDLMYELRNIADSSDNWSSAMNC